MDVERRCRALVLRGCLGFLVLVALVFVFADADAVLKVKGDVGPFVGDGSGLLNGTLDGSEHDGDNTTDLQFVKRGLAPVRWETHDNIYFACRGSLLVKYLHEDLSTMADFQRNYTSDEQKTFGFFQTIVANQWVVDPAVDIKTSNINALQLDPAVDYLNGLSGVEGLLHADTRPRANAIDFALAERTWWWARWIQSVSYKDSQNGIHAPTDAAYSLLTSPENEVIVIIGARSPKTCAPLRSYEQLPKIHKLSDVAYLQHMKHIRFTSGSPPVPWTTQKKYPALRLRWLVIRELYGPSDALALVTSCLQAYGWMQNRLPTYGERVTFPIGSHCYYALLGIPNSVSLAMLLLQHKYRFRENGFTSVTVWSSGRTFSQHGFELPTLLWHTTDNIKRLEQIKTENEDFEARHGVGTATNPWPVRLRPLHRGKLVQ